MGKKATQIISIFGQIEGVIADAMCKEDPSLHRIEPDMIPPTARYNNKGEKAHCALVLTPEQERQFDRRVADLYA
jgi:hypothetical protein